MTGRTGKSSNVRSYLEVVPIDHVRENRTAVLSQFFTPGETHRMRSRPARTLAGILALKRGLVKHFSSVAGCEECSELDFEFDHDDNGAPLPLSLPGPQVGSAFFVSVSHTADRACGLTVAQEDCDE